MIHIAKPLIGEEEQKAVLEVLKTGMIAQGAKVKELEEKFAKLCGTKYAIATNSGTSALHAALYCLGIKPGDEVITTPFSFIATANCILMQGAVPVFVDIKEDTFDIDPEAVKKKITSKTKAIIPVDIFGQPYEIDEINKIAKEHNLKVIEDACQAVNSDINGKKAGSFGDAAAFSLYATKNITSAEGGILTTDNEEYYELAKRFRHHGQSEQTRYEYFDLGYNYRMTDIQAAIALAQLAKVDEFTNKRIENAGLLGKELENIKGIKLPAVRQGAKHVFHQYTILVEDDFGISRDELMVKLKEKGIGSAVFYPKPLHLVPFYQKMGWKEGDFPVAEKMCRRVLSLPVHPGVTKEDVILITQTIKDIQKIVN